MRGYMFEEFNTLGVIGGKAANKGNLDVARRRRSQLFQKGWFEGQAVKFGAKATLAEPFDLVGKGGDHQVVAWNESSSGMEEAIWPTRSMPGMRAALKKLLGR